MTDVSSELPPTQPRRRGGRQKGQKDRFPRYVAQHKLLSKATFGHLVDIIRLAPRGRELDKIGMLRAAQTVVVGRLVSEIENEGDGSYRRRESLVEAFKALHEAELETVKLLPDMARDISGPIPPGLGSGNVLVDLHLPDFQRRPRDDDDD